jgi:hypothetical protein
VLTNKIKKYTLVVLLMLCNTLFVFPQHNVNKLMGNLLAGDGTMGFFRVGEHVQITEMLLRAIDLRVVGNEYHYLVAVNGVPEAAPFYIISHRQFNFRDLQAPNTIYENFGIVFVGDGQYLLNRIPRSTYIFRLESVAEAVARREREAREAAARREREAKEAEARREREAAEAVAKLDREAMKLGFRIDRTSNGSEVIISRYIGTEKAVRIPAQIQGMSVVGIGKLAFYRDQFTSVTIPNSVISIGESAFRNNRACLKKCVNG